MKYFSYDIIIIIFFSKNILRRSCRYVRIPPAELEILRCICDGLEYEEIALQRGITVNTVKYHVSNILQKTGYANRTRLAIAATNQKFIIPKLPEDTEF